MDEGMEIRIHGIGNHDTFSALGSAINIEGDYVATGDLKTELLQPLLTGHETWLLYWSRASRHLNNLLWLLAIPFTLLNTAGHACPTGVRARRFHTTVIVVFGFVLTVGAFLWTVAIVETFFVKLNAGTWVPFDWYKGALILVTVAWLFGVTRQVRAALRLDPQGITPLGRRLALLHAIAISATAGCIWLFAPARDTHYKFTAPCLLGQDGWRCVVFTSDWTAILAAGSEIAVVVGALGCMALAWLSPTRGWQGRASDPWLATGLALLVGTSLLHSVGSVLRSLVDLALFQVNQVAPWSRGAFVGDVPRNWIGLLKPFDWEVPYMGMDLIALVWTPLIWLCVCAILCMWVLRWVRKRFEPTALIGAAFGFAQRRHHFITGASARAYLVMTAVLVAVCGSSFWFVLHLAQVQHDVFPEDPNSMYSPYFTDGWNRLFRFIEVITAWALIFLLGFSVLSKSARTGLGVVGDVIGYWPITYHPLAGHSYRFQVLGRAQTELTRTDRPLVIVGHSQGSVLAVNLVRGLTSAQPNRRLSLITCGSPLDSLYARFFPATFTQNVLEATRTAVEGRWTNFWRKTDPIGTPIPGLEPMRNVEIADGPSANPPQVVRGHGDYWVEPRQRARVDEYLAGTLP